VNFQVVSPILGFDSIKEVTFFTVDDFFSTLQSEGVSFTLINPMMLRSYDIKIPLYYKNLLKIEEGDDIRVYCTVIVHSDIAKSTINFAAPMILNHSKNLLVQVALDSPEYGMSESISTYM
jgi:flagellar assembly factor FliW